MSRLYSYKFKDSFSSAAFEFSNYSTPMSKRRMLQFYPYGFEKETFPIVCLCIRPVSPKFADSLTHRDFLGALINLGIDRSKLGDILIEENTAYVFVFSQIADYITGLPQK